MKLASFLRGRTGLLQRNRSLPGIVPAISALLCIACLVIPMMPGGDQTNKFNPSGDDLTLHSVVGWGLDKTDRDAAIKPGDDFYMSQNGAWFSRTKFTPERPYSAYWNDLRRMVPRRLVALLAEAAANKNSSPQSVENKAGAFYEAFMDEKTAEARGVAPLKLQLAAIRAAKTKRQMAELMGRIAGPETTRPALPGNQPVNRASFGVNIAQDQSEPNRYAVYIGQAGLGMPGPEYYSDPHLADIKAAYETYITRALTIVGWPNPSAQAKQVLAFESRLAEVSWSHEQMLDPIKTYNPISLAQLVTLAPQFDWHAFLRGAQLGRVNRVVIDAKSAFPKLAQVLGETPIEVLQAQQAFVLVDRGGLILDHDAFKANFNFWGKMFNNQSSAPRPRWFYAYATLEDQIGDALGALYVQRYFSPESKAKALEMAAYMKTAFDARIEKAEWMSAATKAQAHEKLAKMTVNIGYSDKLEDYKGLAISDADLYGNVLRSTAFHWHRLVQRLDEPFDHSRWFFTPQMVSYNYNQSENTLEIPAGTFQPPFFDLNADPAVNYGSVGVMIAAMMASGFDNQGRHYDADGKLHDWWTPEETRFFADLTKKLSDQYSSIEPLPDIHIKGPLVVNEAIADLTGWQIALDAYHLSLQGKPAPVLDGFTGDQRVFLGRAQMWRAKFPPDFVRNQLATGRNAMPFLRVNGPVRNMDSWYRAFDVQPGEKMYLAPEDRVHIW